MVKIGVYGGTFNPIHAGHMAAARSAALQLGLDKLYLVPAGLPPHKVLAQGTPEAGHRLAMVRLAAEALELPSTEVEVLDWELCRQGKSYTVDTIRAIRRRHGEDKLWLLMGTDMFLSLPTWYHCGELLSMCRICAFARSGSDTLDRLSHQAEALSRRFGAKVTVLELPEVVETSSTEIRARRAADGGGEGLDSAVYGYILCHGLYGTHADLHHLPLSRLRPAALSLLRHKRIPHVLGTEETAARLARRWGADEEEAQRAALLHDCTKRLSRQEHLALCRQYHIDLDEYEQREDKLLHAKTGAALARDMFGVSQAVYEAILWHTTGKADMAILEKIIYLADYIEPTRNFCDLTELRRLADVDLDRALLLGFTMAVEDLGEQGTVVHPNSVRARDYLKGRLP